MTPKQTLELGLELHTAGRLEEAIALYRQGLALWPTSPEGQYNLGLALQQTGRLSEAIPAYNAALALTPDYGDAMNNLAAAFRTLGRHDEAVALFQRAAFYRPDSPEAYSNLGFALHEAGRFDEAIAECHKALRIKPDYTDAHLNLSMTLLILGDFERGWQEYEGRLARVFSIARDIPAPRWDGGDLTGKTILLYHEQGFGDTIQFIRYAPLIARRGANVWLGCQPELRRLLQCVPNVRGFASVGDPFPPCDVHCPLASLPLMLGTRVESIPAMKEYLTADERMVEEWGKRFLPDDRILKVGLAWSGTINFERNQPRSPFLPALASLGSVRGVRFYSLQKGPPGEQARTPPAGMEIVDWTGDLNDFADTAALMANLDLIITSDTSVAHLAGALGRPTWVMLSRVPDWRWLLNRTDSPWYPTMRLFRQPTMGDWEPPVRQIATELQAMVAR